MSKSKAARLQEIHAAAIKEFDQIQAAVRNERMQCLADRRFAVIAGAQWEGALGEQFENKPRFEFNKTSLSLIRIYSEYRNNRITVDFTPKDGSDDEMADVCDGLYRADEKACSADEAYDNAFDEGVSGGFGAWRICAHYEDEYDDDNDRQNLRIEPIYDADSCAFFDLGAKRQDKSDAKRGYLITPYTWDDFREEFGESPSDWPKSVTMTEFDWVTPDVVWVCELYRVEEKKEKVFHYIGLGLGEDAPKRKVTQSEIDADPTLLDELMATGFRLAREKTATRRVVRKYVLSGNSVLEDCGIIPGSHIPIIPFYGRRSIVDGVERCIGHVRLAKDAQRLFNSIMSWLADMAGRFDIEKPIMTPAQVAGHAEMWARDNVERFAYLLSNPEIDDMGKPVPGSHVPAGYTRAPNIPPAMAALAQMAVQALDDMLGNQQAGEQLQPNISGKAVELIQNRLDMQTFIYMSNLSKSMKRCGEVWLAMKRDVTVERERRMKTIDANGNASSVVMNEPAYDLDTGEAFLRNDLSKANFEVDAGVGPSTNSLRNSIVRSLTGIMQFVEDPETRQALAMATIANLEGEGMRDLRDWAHAKAIRMGLVKPNEEEQQQLAGEAANAKPDPQAQYLMAAAEQAQAEAAGFRAKTVETIASADLKRAQTAKTMAETMGAHNEQQIASAQALQQMLNPPQQGAGPLAIQ